MTNRTMPHLNTNTTPHYLIIGLGQIGLEVANQLAQQGYQVTGVSRKPKLALSQSVTHIQADARHLTAADLGAGATTISHIALIVSPDQGSEQGYRDSYFAISAQVVALSQALPNLQRVLFVSSTGVYGQHQGEVIDVTTAIQPPTSATSRVLLATEQLLQHHFAKRCTIVRPSGIYGASRLRLINTAKQLLTDPSALPANGWTNRIFDTDLMMVLVNLLTTPTPLPVYLATDIAPVPLYQVLTFLMHQVALPSQPVPKLPDDPVLPGKRIIGNLPPAWLQYPTWQAGYQAILPAAAPLPPTL